MNLYMFPSKIPSRFSVFVLFLMFFFHSFILVVPLKK